MSDGDSQEIGQLCAAISRYFPEAFRIRCGWHIVDRGWDRVVKLPLGGYTKRKRAAHLTGRARWKPPPLTFANRVARTLYCWIFLWCRPGFCITREEFVISYALFVDFVRSDDVKAVFGGEAQELILKFVRENVLPHEENFCYYNRHGIFHLETNTNCGLEGLQNGTKNSSNPLPPSTKLDKVVRVLEKNSHLKAVDRSIAICDRAHSTKLWSLTSTSASVTDVAESMITQEWDCRTNYKCIMARPRTWYVTNVTTKNDTVEDGTSTDDEVDILYTQDPEVVSPSANGLGVIPTFERYYQVHLNNDNIVCCSCKNQERMGFPCRHIACVLCSEPSFATIYPSGFPLSAISVMWHTSYYLYGISDDPAHRHIRETYLELQRNDTPGVRIPKDTVIPNQVADISGWGIEKPTRDRVRNYTSRHVKDCVDNVVSATENSLFQSIIPPGMTQQSNLAAYSQESDTDDDCFTLQDGPTYTDRIMQDTQEDYALDNEDAYARLKFGFPDLTNAINCAGMKEQLIQEVQAFFDQQYRWAMQDSRKECGDSAYRHGQKFPMLPPVSKKRKTHGTKHYH